MKQTGVQDKVKTLDEVAREVSKHKRQGKVVVQCHGVFDLIHPGHIKHFEAAKQEGDVLLVTVTADKYVKRGPGRPLFNETLRAQQLAALEVVDLVAVVRQPTAVECIRQVKPQVYAKGVDYKVAADDVTGKIVDEREAVEAHGGRLVFTDEVSFSSSKILNAHLDAYPPATQRYLSGLARRYSGETMTEMFRRLEKLKVLVIGDAVIDQYDFCSQMGKSGKEPLVVSRFIAGESFAGGALGTANHVASVCQRVTLATMLGRRKSWRDFINDHLSDRVKPRYFYRPGAETTVKRRYVSSSRNQKLFEVYYMEDSLPDRKLEKQIMDWLKQKLPEHDLVVVNDFGHGFITDRIIELICKKAKKLAINVQTNAANAGFNLVTKYPRADFVCVDEVELRYATHDRTSDLKQVAKQVQQELDCELIVTTRGSEGSLTMSRQNGFIETPAFASSVVDPVGAGDAFFAFAAPAFAAGWNEDLVPFVGNVAGSLATQIMGHRDVVHLPDVIKFMTRLLK